MCFPGAGIALTVASTAMSTFGAIYQGQQEKALADAQAAAIRQQAEADRQASGFEIAREERQYQRERGANIAAIAGSGVGLAGSPSEALVDAAGEHQLDLEAIAYGSRLRRNQLETQADITRWSGKQSRFAGFLNAGSELIAGASSLMGQGDQLQNQTPNSGINPQRAVRFGRSMFARRPLYLNNRSYV